MFQRFPFEISSLDIATYGGYPVGRVTLLTGRPRSGKTTVASYAIRSFQKRDQRRVCIYDCEYKIDVEWMERIGVDISRVDFVPPLPLEEMCDGVIRQAEGDDIGMVYIDGISMVPSSASIGESLGRGMFAPEPQIINRFMRKLVFQQGRRIVGGKPPFTVLLTNHERHGMSPFPNVPPPVVVPGGVEQLYAASLMVRFLRPDFSSSFSSEGVEISPRVEVRFEVGANVGGASKVAGMFRLWQTGDKSGQIDDLQQLLTWGRESGYIVSEDGRWKMGGKEFSSLGEIQSFWDSNGVEEDRGAIVSLAIDRLRRRSEKVAKKSKRGS